jgi:NAD(P)-dependent dehydrogenase (short-subunit alcohol dehydrogenase family)
MRKPVILVTGASGEIGHGLIERLEQDHRDSWPEDVDDSAARGDWGYAPRYDLDRAFSDYLTPTIRRRYKTGG